jgi:5-methylthioadenosine/S-adenosylhomocysteine deaminase
VCQICEVGRSELGASLSLRGNIRNRARLTAGRSRHTPLNHAPGAVVTLMERSNVSNVLCDKKWRGAIIGYDIPKLRAELEAIRDYVFAAAGIERDLFRA